MKTIDAKNQKLGRVASMAAKMLMGKDEPNYEPNVKSSTKVSITNASRLKIDSKKMKSKEYTRYTGYPSGLRRQKLEEVVTKKGYSEIIRKAVSGMLPRNRLKKLRMKNLEISE